MPQGNPTVRVGFLGDASQLAREAQRASRSVGSVGDSAERMGARMGKAFAIGAAGAATAAVALARSAINSASDLNESLSKNEAVFGKNASAVVSWANDSKKNILLTRQAAIEGAAAFGNLFTALGIGQGAAAGLSTKLVGLASDLSSFNNVGTDEALTALKSGLLGEAEPLRKFGVTLSAARVEAEAFALGLAKPVKNAAAIQTAQIKVAAATANLVKVQKEHGKGTLAAAQAQDALDRAQAGLTKSLGGQKVELTAAQKAQAAYSIILKDTKTAQGDAARTSDGYANKTRILRKQLSDISAELGMKLLPYAQRGATYLSNLITQFQNGTGDGARLKSALTGTADAAKRVGDVLIPIVRFLAEHPRVFFTLAGGVVAFKATLGVTTAVTALRTALFGVAAGEAAAAAGAPAAATGIAAVGTAAAGAATGVGLLVAALAAAVAGFEIYATKHDQFNVDSPDYDVNDPSLAPGASTGGMRINGKYIPDRPLTQDSKDVRDDILGEKKSRQRTGLASQAASAAEAMHATQVRIAQRTKDAADKTAAAQKYAADQAEAAAKRKAEAADALQKASDKMREALEDRKNTARGIRDSLISSNSVVREGLSWTAKDLLARFQTQMGKVRRFSQAIQEMVRKGYSPDIVAQVAQAGVQGGLGTAVGLAHASSVQVRQFNAVQGSIGKYAGAAGGAVAGQMGPIQITTKVMLDDKVLATAVNNWNREHAAAGHR